MAWTLHVEKRISAAHHAGPPGHRCQTNHGHDFLFEVEVSYMRVNEYGWGPDFGKIKHLIEVLDHTDLNQMFSFPPTSENLAEWLFNTVLGYISNEQGNNHWGAVVDFVRVHEGGGNSVTYRG